IGFYPQGEPEAFCLIDPEDVIRGEHVILAFRYGCLLTCYRHQSRATSRRMTKTGISIMWTCDFVDHDMFMRYRGGGVGH
ncbi:hypothetical protein SCLCIDRAFT_45317, partial [Scleroderma citrinum Foug A]